MPLVVVAVVAGLAVGLLGGGGWQALAHRSFRWWPLLAAAVMAQVAADLVETGPAAMVLVSYGLLVGFTVVNLHLVGMPVVLLGLVMNLAVIALNGAMPVRAEAVVAAGIVEREDLAGLDLGAKRRLERGGDRLMALADVIPVPGARQVVSAGDLVLAAGTACVVAGLLLPPGRHHRRRSLARPGARGAGRRPAGRRSAQWS